MEISCSGCLKSEMIPLVMCPCHRVTHTSLLIPDSMGNTEQRNQTFSESCEQSYRINLHHLTLRSTASPEYSVIRFKTGEM